MSHAVADRLARNLFLLLLLTGLVILGGTACQGDAGSSTTATPVNSGDDFQLAPSATDARQQTSTSRLRFVPTATPDTKLDDVKATVTAAGLHDKFSPGRSVDDSFYALIAECGGAILIRDSIIERVIPPDLLVNRGGWYNVEGESPLPSFPRAELVNRGGSYVEGLEYLYPLRMQLIRGWEHTIEWSVNVLGRNGLWKTTASGYITDDCEVNTEVSKRPVP